MPTSVNSALDVRPALQNSRMLRSGYDDFRGLALFADGDGDGGAATTGPNLIITDKGIYEYEGVGTLDAAFPSVDGTTGLLLTAIMTSNNVGVEITPGLSAGTRTRGTFTVGTDDPFYMSATFTLADVSGSDFAFVGFRKAEARQTAVDGHSSYTNIAGIGSISGDIKTYTILSSGTPTTTDTTANWADTESHKLTVLVDKTGKVTYEIDNATPSTVVAFTLASGTVVTPFFRIQNDSDIANGTILQEFAWGFQGDSVAPRQSGRVTSGN